MSELEKALLSNLNSFVGFARAKINDPDLAADVVQDSLLKALKAADKPATEDRIVPWFYQILRRSIIDIYRRRDVRSRGDQELRMAAEIAEEPDAEDNRILCNCFRSLLPALPAQYRELIERIDLLDESPTSVAESLGITSNNLNVRLFRARKQLKHRLEQTCGVCSKHGCLDCTCNAK